jgi:hypothetical protein
MQSRRLAVELDASVLDVWRETLDERDIGSPRYWPDEVHDVFGHDELPRHHPFPEKPFAIDSPKIPWAVYNIHFHHGKLTQKLTKQHGNRIQLFLIPKY